MTRLGVGEAAYGCGILLAQTFHVSNAVFELVFSLSWTRFQPVLPNKHPWPDLSPELCQGEE